jgi:hypothetical protein
MVRSAPSLPAFHEEYQAILSGLIYRMKRGCASAYTRNASRYRFAVPVNDFTAQTWIGDCWITDENGNPDPGLSFSAVPVSRDSIGLLAGRVPQP